MQLGSLRSFTLLLLVLLLAAGQNLTAAVTGSISGVVTDQSGGLVGGAAVVLQNPNTGFRREVKSDATGYYEFLSVPVGEAYSVEVQAPGFQKTLISDLKLLVNQHYRADVKLTVGALSQEVTVDAAPAQVDTSNTQLGDVISDKKMTSLPLNGRSYVDLLGLQAGVVPLTSPAAFNDRPVSGNLGGGALSVSGNRETANSFLVNGGDVQESKNNGASIIPTLDSIQEFRVLTNTFDAEYGRFSGAIVNVVTKSGTNSFHGSAYEFLRNEKLDARNFFDLNQSDPATGAEIPDSARGVFKRNQFGFTVGGPILRNRLFFFSDYQGTREVRGMSRGAVLVPSIGQRTGDFSDYAATGYQPLTGVVQGDNVAGNHTFDETLGQRLGYSVSAGEPYWQPGCNSPADAQAGVCVFPGLKIPQSAWSPVATKTVGLIASPTGYRGGTPFFSTSSEKSRVNDDKIGERVTWSNQRTGEWSFFYHFDTANVFDPFAGANLPGFAGEVPTRAQQANASNTHVFGPTAVNEIRLNYTRYNITQTKPTSSSLGSLASYGFVTTGLGLTSTVPAYEGLPPLQINGDYGFSIGAPAYAINQVNNNYQLTDSFSKITGKHTLKFGGEARHYQVNEYNISTPNGNFSFSGTETGNAFADYLVGAPDSFAQQSYSTFFTRSYYGGLFAQDSYKLKPNLTINMGLRWDIIQPFYETQDRLNSIIWGMQSTQYPGAPTGWVFTGDNGLPRTITPTHYNNFGPRLGIVYSPNWTDGLLGKLFGGPGKTSIRAGSGIYYTAVEDMPAFWTIGDAPFGLYYQSPTQVYLEEPFKDRRRGNDPGQRFPFYPPTPGAPIDWSVYQPIGGSPGVPPDNKTPYAIHYNFTIQRELPRSIIVTAGYVGTQAHHLVTRLESNPGNAATCLSIAANLAGQGRPGEACGPFGEDAIYDLNGDGQYTVGADAFGSRPHSITSGRYASQGLLDFTSNDFIAYIANSSYNALQLSAEKRFGSLRMLAAYTWSKSIDNTSNFSERVNPLDYRLSRSLSAYDMAHNFVVSYSYDLPFDKLSSGNGFSKTLLGGWQIAGITRFTTGLPIKISEGGDRSLLGSGGIDTPDFNGTPISTFDPRTSARHTYFSEESFSLQPLGEIGNASRRFFHGPGLNNWDVSLQKLTKITERCMLEFRVEFFNAFNHTQFLNPNGNFTSGDFGNVTNARDPRIGQVALKISF